jgi:spore germination protein YaaH/flagellar hook assembly protein FlgD
VAATLATAVFAAPGTAAPTLAAGPASAVGPAVVDASGIPGRATVSPAPLGRPDAVADDAAADAFAAGPSEAYLDAMAHATTTYAFAPGAPVRIPLRPRAAAAGTVGDPATSSASIGPSSGAAAPATSSGLRAASAVAAAASLRRQVYGFLPYWELVDPDLRLDYASLSTIAYFSAAASATGSLVTTGSDGKQTSGWAGWRSQALTDIVNAAHANGVSVDLTLTLFAWTTSQAKVQKSVLSSATARAALARDLVGAVTDRGVDGINLDIEPLVAGQEQNLVAFVHELRAALDAVGPGRRITLDVMGSPENYPLEDLVAAGGVDAVFVMGYDYRGSGASTAGSIAPLTGSAYDITETVDRYLARVPADRLILGVPYYGRAWSTVSDSLRAKTQTGAKYGYSATANYALAAQLAEESGRRWDPDEQGPWTAYQRETCSSASSCATSWRELYYDDAESLGLKYQLADARNLAGVGMWALGYDGVRPELAALLRQTFGGGPAGDRKPPRASLRVLPATAPDEGVVVTWGGTDAVGVTAYDVEVATAGGPWTAWLTGVVTTSDVWLGANGRGYAFRARAHDAAGNVSPWTTETASTALTTLARGGFVRVSAASVALRAAPSTTAKRLATAKPGDVFLVTSAPRSAGGATWVQVSGPLVEWPIVSAVRTKAWIAVKQGRTVLAAPTRRPSSTVIAAGLSGYSFDGGRVASLGTAALARRSFSPNGDGSRDTLAIEWDDRVAMTGLTATILRPDASVVGSVALGAAPIGRSDWAWDGRVGGAVVADGTYVVEITGRNGGVAYHAPSARPVTQAQVDRYGVVVDTAAPVLASSTISATTLDPEGAGPASLTVTGSAPDATHWSVGVTSVTSAGVGALVRTLQGDGAAASATWDATSDAGARVPGGTYRVTLRLLDAAGNAAVATWDVTLVRAGPQLTATVTPASISPDGDGTADTTTIAWTADVAVSGTVAVLRGTSIVRTWTQAAATRGSVRWDGTDGKGKAVADGAYHVVITLADATGLPATTDLPLLVDRTVGAFVATPARFAPADGDALVPTTRVTYRLAGPATTRLAILDAAGTEVRVAWDGRAQGPGPFGWTWDGRVDGAFVADGTYTLVLRATTARGTSEVRRPVAVGAFEIRLSATTVASGDRLVVTAIAAEPLKAAPTFTLAQAGLTPVKVTGTAAGSGRWTATFTIRSGGAGTARVTVAARDTAGGLEAGRTALEAT